MGARYGSGCGNEIFALKRIAFVIGQFEILIVVLVSSKRKLAVVLI